MKLHEFYRQFEGLDKDSRFSKIETQVEPTSLFVIFQQLGQVRAQKKYFEEREEHLLNLASLGFKQLRESDGINSKSA